jgi:probable rRNA maturation factor
MKPKRMIDIVVDDGVVGSFPSAKDIEDAIHATCHAAHANIPNPHICVRFAHDDDVKSLNAKWRNKDSVTDVLSFPMQEKPPYHNEEPLGDMILAMPFVEQEALRLNLDVSAHIIHLIIHSTLHLLGYDHITQHDASVMQALECDIMQTLHLHHPYPDGICLHA